MRLGISAAPDWRDEYRAAAISVPALLASLGLDAATLPYGLAETAFPVRVPPHFRGLIQPGDAFDPLLLQVLARDHGDVIRQ